jgi:hypothetical protein
VPARNTSSDSVEFPCRRLPFIFFPINFWFGNVELADFGIRERKWLVDAAGLHGDACDAYPAFRVADGGDITANGCSGFVGVNGVDWPRLKPCSATLAT